MLIAKISSGKYVATVLSLASSLLDLLILNPQCIHHFLPGGVGRIRLSVNLVVFAFNFSGASLGSRDCSVKVSC